MQEPAHTSSSKRAGNSATGFVVFALLVCGAALLGFMAHIMGRINSLSEQVERQQQALIAAEILSKRPTHSVGLYNAPVPEADKSLRSQPDKRAAAFVARLNNIEDRLKSLDGRSGTVPTIERQVETLNDTVLDVERTIRRLTTRVNILEIDAQYSR